MQTSGTTALWENVIVDTRIVIAICRGVVGDSGHCQVSYSHPVSCFFFLSLLVHRHRSASSLAIKMLIVNEVPDDTLVLTLHIRSLPVSATGEHRHRRSLRREIWIRSPQEES